jgi:hypothetical protein
MALTFSTFGNAVKTGAITSGAITSSGVVTGTQLTLTDGITAPSVVAGKAQLYVDTADGDLKVKFGDDFAAVVKADS